MRRAQIIFVQIQIRVIIVINLNASFDFVLIMIMYVKDVLKIHFLRSAIYFKLTVKNEIFGLKIPVRKTRAP